MTTRHAFDHNRASSYIGKSILIGLHIYEQGETSPAREQMHGIITHASPQGIRVALRGVNEGGMLNMPPSLDDIEVASPGTYLIGEDKIEDPDFMATWAIHRTTLH